MNIICGIDDRFVQPCAVLMTSIFENNKHEKIKFHVVTQGLKTENVETLAAIAESYNQILIIDIIDSNILSKCPIKTKDHVSLATYNRLLIPEILSEDEDKCLYLDGDMIVDGDISELYNTDLNNKAAGVVVDQSANDIRHFNRLNYSYEKKYFNAGMMLINLNVWRRLDLTNKLFEYIESNNSNLLFHDQDALNFVLKDLTIYLPLKYNVQFSFFFKNPMISRQYWEEMYKATLSPVIIHYTNKIKPWHKNCIHPYRHIFLKYMALTKWKDYSLQSFSMRYDLYWKMKRMLHLLRLKKLYPPLNLRKEFYQYY